jgi:hypothetical protein
MAIVFGSIDFGYYIFAWAEFQFAARRGAEQASILPPREAKSPTQYQSASYRGTDPCLRLITNEAARSGAFNIATSVQPAHIYLSYHNSANDGTVRVGGRPIFPMVGQVEVRKDLAPLTPLASSLWGGQPWRFVLISRRTVVYDGSVIGGTPARFQNCQD